MSPEELKAEIERRKAKRKTDLQLSRHVVLTYRKIIRKCDLEMNFYYRYHDRKSFEESKNKYEDAISWEAEARRKYYDLALSPLFDEAEHERIISDLEKELQLESRSEAERVLHMLNRIIQDPEALPSPHELKRIKTPAKGSPGSSGCT